MLASPTASFRTREPSMSPSCRAQHSTPSKLKSSHYSSYDSPMLTPSPFRRSHRSPNKPSIFSGESDDFFLQSPFRSPSPARRFHPSYTTTLVDDSEDASSATPYFPVFPASSSQPLLTPIKQSHRASSRPVLSIKYLNTVPHIATAAAPNASINQTSHVGVGTKRKSTPLATTPLRNRVLTPLCISTTKDVDHVTGVAFDRLAPLPAPRFTVSTPQTKAEMDVHLQRETNTMTNLRITDLNHSDDEFGTEDDDSGCEVGGDEKAREDTLFLGTGRLNHKPVSLGRALGRESLANNVKAKDEEVAEAVSPGGHITKRRARSRPVSLELLESVNHSPSATSSQNDLKSNGRSSGGVAFPSARARPRVSSPASSSSEAGSPLPRRRVNGSLRSQHPQQSQIHSAPIGNRTSLNRLESASSATLFFGPAIPAATNNVRKRTSTTSSSSAAVAATSTVGSRRARPTMMMNRHSYAGHGCESLSALPWNMIQARSASPSPGSSPLLPQRGTSEKGDDFDDEDIFFGVGPPDSSFVLNVTAGTPSPRSKTADQASLPKKYRPRDSGVMLSDDEDMSGNSSGDFLSVMPAASMSVDSIYSDGEDGLITPGTVPGTGSGWPEATVAEGNFDDMGDSSFGGDSGVNAFIMRTLVAGTKGQPSGPKKVPGTPVKKVKTSRLIVDRPWQSVVATKVGLGFDAGGNKPPRKSLPAAFPVLGQKACTVDLIPTDSEGEGEEPSPSWRKDKYVGLGLGQPPSAKENIGTMPRTRWLMRRSSSGAFSSGSDASMGGTPTRRDGRGWDLLPPRVSTEFSPSKNAMKFSPGQSISGSSSNSVTTLHSPSLHPSTRHLRHLPISGGQRRTISPASDNRILSEPSAQDQPGRFARDFEEVDEVGSGEFGKVTKVRYKDGREGELFAVKQSKRFEGVRHRLRLREEVDILQHLSRAAASAGWPQGRHPNVLAYIDSWEQEEALYIRTELCEFGNFGHFLCEYGRAFPRLDEARVWKIIVDLGSGLRFIHDSGVIHLDLKPANIFVTSQGRFKIGDFGMASVWPRTGPTETGAGGSGFEREGDKVYLAPEVLQGEYGKAADIFSFGVTMLETASNIIVPDQGEPWHRLRQEDFSQLDLDESPELLELIKSMMRTNPAQRVDVQDINSHPVVLRTRVAMERMYGEAKASGSSVFAASPLAGVPDGFLAEILGSRLPEGGWMDINP